MLTGTVKSKEGLFYFFFMCFEKNHISCFPQAGVDVRSPSFRSSCWSLKEVRTLRSDIQHHHHHVRGATNVVVEVELLLLLTVALGAGAAVPDVAEGGPLTIVIEIPGKRERAAVKFAKFPYPPMGRYRGVGEDEDDEEEEELETEDDDDEEEDEEEEEGEAVGRN